MSVTATIPANATGVLLMLGHGSNIPTDATWWTDILVEQTSLTLPFFKAGDHPDEDVEAIWDGAVGASPTILRGINVSRVGQSGSGCLVYKSRAWAMSGEYSLRIDAQKMVAAKPEATVADQQLSNYLMQLVAGKTYTVVAYLRLTEVGADYLNSQRRMNFYWSNNSGATYVEEKSAQISEAGVHLIRFTFTVPADANRAILRLGGNGLGSQAWWDDVTIVEGTHPDLTPFHGSMQSTQPVNTLDIQRRIDDGEWVTIATNIPPDGAVTDPIPTLNGVNTYRAISRTDDVTNPGPTTTTEWEKPLGGTHFYLNAGENFHTVAHAPGHQTDDILTIEQTTHQFAGNPHPVTYYGEHETYQIPFTGPLIDTATPRPQWLELLRQRGTACYRDSLGRRTFGTLQLTLPTAGGLTTVNGTITQSDYIEGEGDS